MNNIYFLSNNNISRNFICDDEVHPNQNGTLILLLLQIVFLILIDYIVNPVYQKTVTVSVYLEIM